MKRKLTITHFEPWLLGWCHWEIVTEYPHEDGYTIRTTLASGRWKWRGRRAEFQQAATECGPFWTGPSDCGPPIIEFVDVGRG